MRAIVVYDSVSPAKLTAKVGETIAGSLKQEGLEVISIPVGNAKHINIEEYDLLVVGSPTMGWQPTKVTMEFLKSLEGKKFSGKAAATFDTQIKSFMSGNANKAMEAKLKALGYTIAIPPLVAFVKSKDRSYHLLEGELEKIGSWSVRLATDRKDK